MLSMRYLLFCPCVHFTHITCTNAETALQFGTAASWWQRCHAAYVMMQVKYQNQDCKYYDSPNCHTFKKVIAKSSASTSADSRFIHMWWCVQLKQNNQTVWMKRVLYLIC